MKRSEMVKKGSVVLAQLRIRDWSNCEIISKILEEFEEAGMLPPTVNVPAFGVKDNMWEPEDD